MKKVLVIVLVAVVFIVVLGVNDHLDYDGFQDAVDYVKDTSQELDTFELLQGFISFWKYFDITVDQEFVVFINSTDESIGRFDENWYAGAYSSGLMLVSDDTDHWLTSSLRGGSSEVSLYAGPGGGSSGGSGSCYLVGTMYYETVLPLKPLEVLLSHDAVDGWADYVLIPAYFVMIIVGCILWLAVIIIGSVESLMSVVLAGLYLLGLAPLL